MSRYTIERLSIIQLSLYNLILLVSLRTKIETRSIERKRSKKLFFISVDFNCIINNTKYMH